MTPTNGGNTHGPRTWAPLETDAPAHPAAASPAGAGPDWSEHLARQAARHAQREAELAAREARLVARIEERGRVIDRLTDHLNVLSVQCEQDRIALEQALQTIADLEARLEEYREQLDQLTGRRLLGRRPA